MLLITMFCIDKQDIKHINMTQITLLGEETLRFSDYGAAGLALTPTVSQAFNCISFTNPKREVKEQQTKGRR